MPKNKTLVLGASENPQRYSNIAMRMFNSIDEPIVAIGRKEGVAHNIKIQKGQPQRNDIQTVTLYLGPRFQTEYIDYIIHELKPERIIFNPGTENYDFAQKAEESGIRTIEACTLVMIRTGQY